MKKQVPELYAWHFITSVKTLCIYTNTEERTGKRHANRLALVTPEEWAYGRPLEPGDFHILLCTV